jgi:hypothetical protein
MSAHYDHAAHYIELGFGLVTMPSGTKIPKAKKWQDNPITTLKEARAKTNNAPNIGVNHAHSGTCTLDVDDYELTKLALDAVGINLDALLAAPGPKIRSKNGPKPIYRLSEGLTLGRHHIEWGKTVFELRAGKVQDLLPPSIHPDTKQPYTWEPAPPQAREDIPEIPGGLLALWQNWDALKPQMDRANPAYVPPEPKRRTEAAEGGVIAAFNDKYTAREVLEDNGYKARGKDRYLPPNSTTGVPGVKVFDDGRVFSHNGSDPLAGDYSHDAFSVYTILEHDGDVKAAVRAAAEELGMNHKKGNRANLPGGQTKGAANFAFGTTSETASNKENTVLDSNDSMQRVTASKNTRTASNKEKPVLDNNDLMQSPLHQKIKWGETKRPDPPEWLVENLIQYNAENAIAGEPGAGKSWLMADLLVSVATGTPFLGRRTKQGAGMYINFDDSEAMPRTWAERTCRQLGYDFTELPLYYWQPDPERPYPPAGLITPYVFDFVLDAAAELKPRLIVVDAFSTSFPGKDGNKAQDVVEVFEALRQLRVAAGGASIMLVDHTPKQVFMESKRRGVSGSQQKHARTRTVSIVSLLEPAEAGNDNTLEWRVHKINAAPYQEPFAIKRHVDTLRGTARLEVGRLPEQDKAPKETRAAAAALTIIQAQGGRPIERQELIDQVRTVTNTGNRTIIKAITEEIEGHPNVVTARLPGRGNPKVYRWHGETPDDSMQSDSMQNADLMQTPLHQIVPVPDAKNGFDELMQSKNAKHEDESADDDRDRFKI